MHKERTRETFSRNSQTVIFYGIDYTKENIIKFFQISDILLKSEGLVFDKMMFYADLNRRSQKGIKYNISKLIEKCSDKEYIFIDAFKEWDTGWNGEFQLSALIQNYYARIIFADFEYALDFKKVGDIMARFSSALGSTYSFCVNIPYYKDTGYATGIGSEFVDTPMVTDPIERAKRDRDCRWGYWLRKKVWLHGYLRDVYPVSFLCEAQAKGFLIKGKSLFDHICEDKKLGIIEKIQNMYLWTIPDDRIDSAREKLDKLGFIP